MRKAVALSLVAVLLVVAVVGCGDGATPEATAVPPTTEPAEPTAMPVAPTATSEPAPEPTATPEPEPTEVPAVTLSGQIVWSSDRAGSGELNVWAMDPATGETVQLTTGFKNAWYPAISPDGSQVVFSTNDTGTWYIHVMDADGSNLTQVTDFSSAVASWSPDGSSLVFNSDHRNEPKDTPDLYAMNLDGSDLVELLDAPETADFDARWSPDGSHLLFTSNRSGNMDLYVMDANGENITQLTSELSSESGGRWSPDGSRIVFVSDRAGNLDLFVMNADGSNVVQLTETHLMERDPCWSPDGKQIVFASDRRGKLDLYVMNADGSDVTQLTDDDANDVFPDW
jgi:Tol biopolymer transport system component